jgi:hypothetical protein
MTGVVLLARYFICVHIGMELRLAILAGHIICASKRFSGVTEFFYYALADGAGALLSRIRPAKLHMPRFEDRQCLFEGFT